MEFIVKALLFLSVCHSINGFFDLRNKHMREEKKNIVEYTFCKEQWCKQFSPMYVQKTFRGVFQTKQQYSLHREIYNKRRTNYLQREGVKNVNNIIWLQGDGDSCCVTNLKTYRNTSMNNLYGQERSVVQMPDAEPPMYQFIPHAFCETVPGTDCEGSCVLEYVSLTFLIYDTATEDMVFDQFLLPGYCSCKRILR